MTLYFHTTDAADAILQHGFRDSESNYGMVNFTLRGVFLANTPVNANEGAVGDQVLEVTLPDDLDLTDFELVEAGKPYREWCVPAALINEQGTVRRLSEAELEEIEDARWAARLPNPMPEPGLNGTYSGSCIVCLNGCDTGLAFVGPAEWGVAGLVVLGVPTDDAQQIVVKQLADVYGITEAGVVPDGDVTIGATVCGSCVSKSGTSFPLGLIATGEVPGIRPAR